MCIYDMHMHVIYTCIYMLKNLKPLALKAQATQDSAYTYIQIHSGAALCIMPEYKYKIHNPLPSALAYNHTPAPLKHGTRRDDRHSTRAAERREREHDANTAPAPANVTPALTATPAASTGAPESAIVGCADTSSSGSSEAHRSFPAPPRLLRFWKHRANYLARIAAIVAETASDFRLASIGE